jgi:HEAT repeats
LTVDLRAAPRTRIAAEVAARGRRQFVTDCVAVLEGGHPDRQLLDVLGGRSVPGVLADLETHGYWLRVWAVRGLLWQWDDTALPALMRAFDDEAWRVREMALKVVARHLVDDALEPALGLRADPVPRVRAAAERAVATLTAAVTEPG